MKLSATNGPLYHFYGDGDDLHATLDHVKRAGFHYVDISFWSRYDKADSRYYSTDNAILAEEYKRELETVGLIPIGSHEPAGNLMGDDGGEYHYKKTSLAIDLAGRIGIPSITLHQGLDDKHYISREEFMEINAREFRRLIPIAEKYGIRLLIENLSWQGLCPETHLATARDLNELLDRIDHPLFGVCWDVGHANLCNLDQYAELTKLGSRLENLHVHDNYGGRRTPHADLHLFPFWGNVNFDAIMTALLEIGYQGTFNMEVDNPIKRVGAIGFSKNGERVTKLEKLPLILREDVERLQYEIGKHILETYNCFEE